MKGVWVITVFLAAHLSASQTGTIIQQHEFIEKLHQEVKGLRGQVEMLEHKLKVLQSDVNLTNEDNKLRFEQLESAVSNGQEPPQVTTQAKPKVESSQDLAGEPTPKREKSIDIPALQPEGVLGSVTTPEEALKYGQDLIQQGDLDQATTVLSHALTQKVSQKTAMQINYWLGEIYLNKEQYKRAARVFGSAAETILALQEGGEKIDKGPEIFFKLAQSLAKSNQFDDAKLTIQQAEKSFPRMPENIHAPLRSLKEMLP